MAKLSLVFSSFIDFSFYDSLPTNQRSQKLFHLKPKIFYIKRNLMGSACWIKKEDSPTGPIPALEIPWLGALGLLGVSA